MSRKTIKRTFPIILASEILALEWKKKIFRQELQLARYEHCVLYRELVSCIQYKCH